MPSLHWRGSPWIPGLLSRWQLIRLLLRCCCSPRDPLGLDAAKPAPRSVPGRGGSRGWGLLNCPHLCLQPEELTNALEISNIVFTSMFALEMLLKLLACGPLGYIRNPYNIFDGIIVVIRWVPTLSPGQRGPGSSTLWQKSHLQSKTQSAGGSATTALYDRPWEAGAW